jgi:hypothetical protein
MQKTCQDRSESAFLVDIRASSPTVNELLAAFSFPNADGSQKSSNIDPAGIWDSLLNHSVLMGISVEKSALWEKVRRILPRICPIHYCIK